MRTLNVDSSENTVEVSWDWPMQAPMDTPGVCTTGGTNGTTVTLTLTPNDSVVIVADTSATTVGVGWADVQATGAGGMENISKLLWKMQSAQFPLKITEMQLGSRNDNSSDLALQLKISTLYRAGQGSRVPMWKGSFRWMSFATRPGWRRSVRSWDMPSRWPAGSGQAIVR